MTGPSLYMLPYLLRYRPNGHGRPELYNIGFKDSCNHGSRRPVFWFILATTFLASDYIHFYTAIFYLLLQLFWYFNIDIHSITLPLLFCMETLEVSQERVPPLDWQGRQRLGNPVWSRLSYHAGLSAPAHHPHKYRPVCPCSPGISAQYTTLTICSAARIAARPGRHHLSACFIVAGTPAGRFLHSQPWPCLLVCYPMLPDPNLYI